MIIKPQQRHQSINTARAHQSMIPIMAGSRTYGGPAYYDSHLPVTGCMACITAKQFHHRTIPTNHPHASFRIPSIESSSAFHISTCICYISKQSYTEWVATETIEVRQLPIRLTISKLAMGYGNLKWLQWWPPQCFCGKQLFLELSK